MRHCPQRSGSSIFLYALWSLTASFSSSSSSLFAGGRFASAFVGTSSTTYTVNLSSRNARNIKAHPLAFSLLEGRRNSRKGTDLENQRRHFSTLLHSRVGSSSTAISFSWKGLEDTKLPFTVSQSSTTTLFASSKGKESSPASAAATGRKRKSSTTATTKTTAKGTKKSTTKSKSPPKGEETSGIKSISASAETKKTKKAKTKTNSIAKADTTTKTKATEKMPPKKKTTTKKSSVAGAKKGGNNHNPSINHAPESLVTSEMEITRTKLLTPSVSLPRTKEDDSSIKNACIVYWMMRDMRTIDNWALLFAQSLAVQCEVPLKVVYALPPPPSSSESGQEEEEGPEGCPPSPAEMSLTERHGVFLLDGLKVVSEELSEVNVPFDVLCPSSRDTVGKSVHEYCQEALAVVCDMSPLRYPRQWIEKQGAPLLEKSGIPLYQVDAHNIVPVWIASPKREVGARTLRPKINNVFGDYCTEFPEFVGNAHLKGESNDDGARSNNHDWERYKQYMKLDNSIQPVSGMTAGHQMAMKRFQQFCTSTQQGLKNFDTHRNDPNLPSVCTNLSPWINFGQISFQRLALDVRALKKHPNGTAAYIEEGVVRRELSDNFVYYTPDGYDNLSGAADWARESLELHSSDERENLYTWKELEKGQTHDDLWNAAQLQLVREGGMHGFMRMYWAKKVLEWTVSPAYALATAQYFNDRYAYDGNDPNGFVGVGWSIMGIHDMGWKERPIFGKIRYMNYAGCKRKFKVDSFVARYKGAAENAARVIARAGKGGAGQVAGKKRKAT